MIMQKQLIEPISKRRESEKLTTNKGIRPEKIIMEERLESIKKNLSLRKNKCRSTNSNSVQNKFLV
jgi:hypothetical protein